MKNTTTEKKAIYLTEDEWFTVRLAMEHAIEALENRFTDDERYIHPAQKYRELLQKIEDVPF